MYYNNSIASGNQSYTKKIDVEKKIIAILMLCEGNSVRGVECMTDIDRDTIMRWCSYS